MRRKQTPILALAIWASCILAPAYASGQVCPESGTLRWRDVRTTATRAHELYRSSTTAARARGARQARAHVPRRINGLNVSAQPEWSPPGNPEPPEHIASASLNVQLGRQLARQRDAYEAMARVFELEGDLERERFVRTVEDAYTRWWALALELAHLEHYTEDALATLEELRRARERGDLMALEIADLEGELAWLENELARTRQDALEARATLVEVLGEACELTTPPSIETSREQPPNPWRPLEAKVEELPQIQYMRAQIEAAKASRNVQVKRAPQLSLGAGVRGVGGVHSFPFATLSLTIPLGDPNAPAREMLAGEVEARRAELAVNQRMLAANLNARALRYDALSQRLASYPSQVLSPLEARVDLIAKAHAAGHARLRQLLLARRELHEAHHEWLRLIIRQEIEHQLAASLEQRLLQSSKDKP